MKELGLKEGLKESLIESIKGEDFYRDSTIKFFEQCWDDWGNEECASHKEFIDEFMETYFYGLDNASPIVDEWEDYDFIPEIKEIKELYKADDDDTFYDKYPDYEDFGEAMMHFATDWIEKVLNEYVSTLDESLVAGEITESLLEDKQIWSSDSTYDYIWNADIEELKSQLDDMDVDYSDWDDDKIRDYLLDDTYEGEFEYEDFKYNLLPAIDNQCYGDSLVLFGDAANWRGTYAAAKVLHKASDLERYIYPKYDATTQISEDDTGIYYTQSTHDTPTGGTKIYLYSLKDETDLEELDKWCSESGWFDPEYDYSVDFLENNTDYKDIKDLIDKGILTPIKNIV